MCAKKYVSMIKYIFVIKKIELSILIGFIQ